MEEGSEYEWIGLYGSVDVNYDPEKGFKPFMKTTCHSGL